MMLTDNRIYLQRHNPSLLDILEGDGNGSEKGIAVETSKSGLPTVQVLLHDTPHYLHSKYDPATEAERLIKKLEDAPGFDYVLFIGAGLGYHIKQFAKSFPNKKIVIYEPNKAILNGFLSFQKVQEITHLQQIITSSGKKLEADIHQLIQKLGSNVYVYVLPVYQKVFEAVAEEAMHVLKEALKLQKSNLMTTVSFQNRWTVNSIKNFPALLQTPNILHDLDKRMFEGKPAILVAAGPSLTRELEHLQYIKENGLAYIFSVGSATNALIEADIFPDAACTYDPTELNQMVLEKAKQLDMQQIPLIFGSSVGFESLEDYPGPMLHMITSQDTVSPYFLDVSNNYEIVNDAASIAVITYQLLLRLGFSTIILVGQNLAYQDKKRYAKGIRYEHISDELSEDETKDLITVTDVAGNEVATTETFNLMRKQLEGYIQRKSDIQTINTTVGGARIEGAHFMELSEVIPSMLKERAVNPKWFAAANSYNKEYIHQQLTRMERFRMKCAQAIEHSSAELDNIQRLVGNRLSDRLENRFAKFDKEFAKLKKNSYYQVFIEPMLRVQNKRLSDESHSIRYESDRLKKGELVAAAFGKFLGEAKTHYSFVEPFVKEMEERIQSIEAIKAGEQQ